MMVRGLTGRFLSKIDAGMAAAIVPIVESEMIMPIFDSGKASSLR